MAVKTYDPREVIVTFGGIPLTGFADGTFITVSRASERFTKAVGADGEVARSRNNDNTHEVTLTLIQTSPSNNYLSIIARVDKIMNMGVKALSITDLSGSTLFFWNEAWINNDPDVEFNKEIGDRAWVFNTGQVKEDFIGGSLI